MTSSQLPHAVSFLLHLEVLYLFANQHEELSCELKSLKNLRMLNLSHNRLRSLNPHCLSFTRLQEPYLSHNPDLDLENLTDCLKDAPELKVVHLAGNRLSELPAKARLFRIYFLQNKRIG